MTKTQLKLTLLLVSLIALISISYSSFLVYRQYTTPEDQEQQNVRLSQELWKLERQVGFAPIDKANTWALTVRVRHASDLEYCHCWGQSFPDKNYIEVEDLRDMPMAIPMSERVAFQNRILQHEVMHFKLWSLGVPDDVQDGLIRELQPLLVKP